MLALSFVMSLYLEWTFHCSGTRRFELTNLPFISFQQALSLTLASGPFLIFTFFVLTILMFTFPSPQSGEHKEVLQFHYTTWPDFGTPNSPAAFLDFLMAVRESGALDPEVGPPIIHCSAGIGRSGTFCLVDTCLVLVRKYALN